MAALAIAQRARATELDIKYGPDPAQVLDVCTPDVGGGNRPAVLLVHGGGWRVGSRMSLERRCQAFVAHGIVAVPVDYRLIDGSPANAWPAQLLDVQLAIRWLRAHAATYGVDPGHICAYGESSGAHLALLLGEDAQVLPGDMQSILPQVSPRADCVVSVAGPTDLVSLFEERPGIGRGVLGPVSRAQALEEARAASPLFHISPGMAPVLQVQGDHDHAVPPEQATEMQAALAKAGVKSWLITHSGAHGFTAISPPEAKVIWQKIFAFVEKEDLPGEPAEVAADALVTH